MPTEEEKAEEYRRSLIRRAANKLARERALVGNRTLYRGLLDRTGALRRGLRP